MCFEITMTMHLGIENIDPVKYDTLKLLTKKISKAVSKSFMKIKI